MKLLLLLGLTAVTATAADLPGWKLVWSDEFDQPGLLNPAMWGYEKGLVRNNEKQFDQKTCQLSGSVTCVCALARRG